MLQRIQKMICMMLLAMLVVSTVAPALAKSVSATVNSSSAKVYQKASKSSKYVKVKKGTKVTVTAVSGDWAKVSKSGVTGYMPKKYLSASSSSTSWKSKVVKKNWFNGGSSVLKKGSYGYIYDIDTGISLRIKRMGGHYHADVEPATASDTAKLLKIAGGKFSWKSHAVILQAGGKYVACAINTLPHGDQTIRSNNYNGQFCLHMTGSLTHASSKENSAHQKSINRAYKWARG